MSYDFPNAKGLRKVFHKHEWFHGKPEFTPPIRRAVEITGFIDPITYAMFTTGILAYIDTCEKCGKRVAREVPATPVNALALAVRIQRRVRV